MSGLTKAQRDLLSWIESTSGVIDITDESLVNRLISKGFVLKFFESNGGELRPVWCITEAGRQALEAQP